LPTSNFALARFPILAEDALDVIGNRVVQFFVTPTLADFPISPWNVVGVRLAVFLLHLDLPTTIENWEEHNIQPIRDREKVKNSF
jgi:hypothetical protein